MAQVSTRRAKMQESKARRQLFISIIVAAALGLIFIFFLMPLLFSFVVGVARQGSSGFSEQSDVVPPQRPVLQPIPNATNETDLEVSGFTEPKAQVTLYIDGVQFDQTQADDEGAFKFEAQMVEGEHELWVSAADEAGNVSADSQRYLISIDLTAPSVEIEQPVDGAVFTLPRERTQTVKGKVSEKARVSVNGALTQTDSEGNFSVTMQLRDGENEIIVSATDEAGNSSEEKLIVVEYRP